MFKFLKSILGRKVSKFPNTHLPTFDKEGKEIAYKLLSNAKVKIASGRLDFICLVLQFDPDYHQNGIGKILVSAIGKSLTDRAGTLESWLIIKNKCDSAVAFRAARSYRLEWIDDMIAKLNKQES